MKIMSEKTGKFYATIDECLAAEKAYDAEVAKKKEEEEKALAEAKAKREAAVAERKVEAEKVEAARQALIKAQNEYKDALETFCSKYGAYHFTLKSGDQSIFDLFNGFFDNLFL